MGPQLPKRVRRIGLMAMASSAALLLASCSTAEQDSIKRLAQPDGVTDRTEAMHNLWMGSWLAAMIVGVVVWGLIGYACVKFYRRRDDEIPVQTRYNLPIEILYTVAPVVMVLVFFFFTVTVQNEVLAEPKSGEAEHKVIVVGQQWSWTFNYDKDDALDGSTTVYDGGTTADRPTLYLPVNKSVDIELHSPDVIHSFWVPAFLFKMDVIPGRVPANHFSFTPTREGTFVGRCAELCGVYHSRMLFNVKVVSEDEYASHLQDLQDQGNIGPALGGAGVGEQSGLESSDQSGGGE